MARLSDINAQRTAAGASTTNVRYNSRTADANYTSQEAKANIKNLEDQKAQVQQQQRDLIDALSAGKINTTEYNAKHQVLSDAIVRINNATGVNQGNLATSQQHLGEATAVYNNQAAGLNTQYTPNYNEYGVDQGGTSTAVDPNMGVIEQSARDRIGESGMMGLAAEEQYQTSKAEAQATMSNTGLPGNQEYRANPRQIEEAKKKAASEARISSIKGFNQIPIYNKKTGELVGYKSVEDPAKTKQMQDEARTAAENKAAADERFAAGLQETENANATAGGKGAAAPEEALPQPDPASFLSTLSPGEAQAAGGILAPLFDIFRTQSSLAEDKYNRGTSTLKTIGEKADALVAKQQEMWNQQGSAWSQLSKNLYDHQIESAERTRNQEMRLAQQQKDYDQKQYERAIRDQNIKNEEEKQMLLLSNGISGGWRSSMHTGKMIDRMKSNETTLSDLWEDKTMNSDKWTEKMMTVEENYHANTTAAYDAYNVNILTLTDKLSARAAEIDKTIFNNEVSQLEATNKLTDDWYDSVGKIADNARETLIEINKNTLQAAKEARTELQQQKTDLRLRYQFHVGTYGDTDPTGYKLLVDEAASLGITLPATPPQTLEQKSMAMQAMSKGIDSTRMYTPHVVNGVDLSSVARTIVGRLTSDRRGAVSEDLFTAIESGDMNTFMNKAVDAGLEGKSVGLQTEYSNSLQGLANTGTAISLMSGIEGTNIYKKIYNEKLLSALAQNKDQKWLQALGTAQLSQANLIKQLIGVAQTESEKKILQEFIPSSGDTVADSITKLRISHNYFQQKYDTAATVALGLGYGSAVKNGQIVNFSAPAPQGKTTDNYEDDSSLNPGTKTGSMLPMSYNTLNGLPPEASGAPTQIQGLQAWISDTLKGKESAGYDSPHLKKIFGITMANAEGGLHGGVDIAIPKGTEVKPLVGGKVVSLKGKATDKSGYGLSITVEDNQGIFHKYSHLSNVPQYIKEAIDRGEMPDVTPSTVIAYSGNSGTSTGPHLDYRARKADGKWIRVEEEYSLTPQEKFALQSSNKHA